MSNDVESTLQPCGVCGARVAELRRGRCWGCYAKWADLRPAGKGATCIVCAERRRDMLRMTEVHGRSLPMCHGCTAKAYKLAPLPHSIEGLRAALRRDRRAVSRRDDHLDQRIFPRERRVGDRRGPPRELTHADTDPAVMLAASADDIIIELDLDDVDIIEMTKVRSRAAS